MYFKWDLFRRHIKKRVYVAKNGFKWLFLCMGKTHKYTNVRTSEPMSWVIDTIPTWTSGSEYLMQ